MTEFLKTWFKKRAFYNNNNNNNNNNNQLCFTRVAHNVKRLTNPWPSNSRSNWNLEILIFGEGGKPGNRKKTLGARTRTNNKLNPLMAPGLGFEPGPHWWEASAITTAPSPLPRDQVRT